MASSNDKPRISARESARLRATIASEPSGGYAFHDERRVPRKRHERGPTSSSSPGHGDATQSQQPWADSQEAWEDDDSPEQCPAFDQAFEILGKEAETGSGPCPEPSADGCSPGPESEAAAADAPSEADRPENGSAAPPQVVPAVGIWEALPSVVSLPTPDNDDLQQGPAALERASHPNAGGEHDALVRRVEQLVERNAWDELAQMLAGRETLPPALSLLSLIAQRETQPGDDKQQASALSQQIISTVAHILGLPESSPAALLISKRLMRKNPGWTRSRPAGRLSMGIVLAGLSLGAAIGWLVTKLTL